MGRRKGTTAFPIARIKKIMQSDDDVGKIATNTPALVGKALECLMEDILRDSAQIALERRARTITPSHLKATVGASAQFDFLRPLLSNVPDISETLEAANAPIAPNTKPKRPRSTAAGSSTSSIPRLATDAPVMVKRRKPAASPVAVAAVAKAYASGVGSGYNTPTSNTTVVNLQGVASKVIVPDRIERMQVDDDEDDYDEDDDYDGGGGGVDGGGTGNQPPAKIDLAASMSSPIASVPDIPVTPALISEFGVVRPTGDRKEKSSDGSTTSSRARVSVHALLS